MNQAVKFICPTEWEDAWKRQDPILANEEMIHLTKIRLGRTDAENNCVNLECEGDGIQQHLF